MDTLNNLINQLTTIRDQMGSHPTLEGDVVLYLDSEERWFKIKAVEPDRNWGCNCWLGANIELEDDDERNDVKFQLSPPIPEPSEKMISAGTKALKEQGIQGVIDDDAKNCYLAMRSQWIKDNK